MIQTVINVTYAYVLNMKLLQVGRFSLNALAAITNAMATTRPEAKTFLSKF